jgi:hypothetical protein
MQGSKTSAEVCMPPIMNTEILQRVTNLRNYMKDGVQMTLQILLTIQISNNFITMANL